MKTKIQLVSKAFDELRINGITSQANTEDEILALESMEQLVSELTFDIGWRFEDSPDPNAITGIPLFAESAIYLSLAVKIAPRYGKDPEMYRMQAGAAMSRLLARVQRPRQTQYSTRMPMGLGNRRQFPCGRQFMPPVSQAPDNVNTEQFVINDVRQLSVDFTDYLLPNEVILTYTTSTTAGISLSNESLSVNAILFDVTAVDYGYHVVTFSVVGDSGTKVNRRLDFDIYESESMRGNP